MVILSYQQYHYSILTPARVLEDVRGLEFSLKDLIPVAPADPIDSVRLGAKNTNKSGVFRTARPKYDRQP